MDEENEKQSLLDISQYSEKTRRIIFSVLAVILVAVVAVAMFIISPQNEKRLTESENPSNKATAAPVNNEVTSSPSASAGTESYNGNFPKDENDEQAIAQKKIIEKGLEEQKALIGKDVSDEHGVIPEADKLQSLASKGMLEYCTDLPGETKEQKQARLKPYFHADSSGYQSPQSLFYLTNCSIGDSTEASYDESKTNVIVYVGMAWAGQYEKDGKATTGYTQYRVIVDKNGIVNFDD